MQIQKARATMKQLGIKTWAIYQYQSTYEVGLNPLANDLCEIKELVTRPWFCIINVGKPNPTWVIQSMEQEKFAHVMGEIAIYTSYDSLREILSQKLKGTGPIAMEIVPYANNPALSRVDYGTVQLVQKVSKRKVISSSELVGNMLGDWESVAYRSHKAAVASLIKVLTATQQEIRNHINKVTDYEIQLYVEELYKKYALITLYHPIIAIGKSTGNPHFFPSQKNPRTIKDNQLVLIDIWGKTAQVNSVYSDITTMCYTGIRIPPPIQNAWSVLIRARDAALAYITDELRAKRVPQGNSIDAVARKILEKAGYGTYFVHRLGHNIAAELHGYGPNLDGYETNETRKLILNSGYSIEPGIYTKSFGLRSEINIYISKSYGVEVTTPAPKDIALI